MTSVEFVAHTGADAAVTGGLACWSPDAALLASASGKDVRVMDASTLRVRPPVRLLPLLAAT